MRTIKITENDKAIMQGMSALGTYGGSINKARNALRRCEKDINKPSNLDNLREAHKHVEDALNALETWITITGDQQ